ncbi:PREDICTED: protein brown-like isoform X1 [Papilio polytes]|uniref:protein brown-like isoform X1 n=1 Tax=Papilio polytes TaxID=76194 RepID=UPI0006764A73|nr:PREDICTED: protein brown-like isoform X1 [Papilio polytes]
MEIPKRNDDFLGIVDVVLKVRELKVWTPEEKSWWRKKPSKPKTLILNNVSDCIKSGEFLAILGPSGAGKTTYLVSLCGKCTLPSEGVVTVNGRNVTDLQPGEVEILPQFDVFMDCLSVKEHLVFMTEIKSGSAKNQNNSTVLNAIMEMLKLKVHENTLIQSLSGGERRLLSLASSLLSNPQILICDEPTTGLDSYNASLVVGLLKGLSMTGKIVICSVHQPSSDLFKEFNSISLMSEGKLLFHGSHEDCRNLFQSLNLRCPKNYNPAEFYIKAVSSYPCADENYVDRIMENNRNRFHQCDETCCETHVMPRLPVRNRSWSKQVQLLMWRFSIRLRRNYKNLAISLLLSTVIGAVVIGICFAGSKGTTQRGVQNLRGLLWLICSEVSFSLSYAALYAFEADLSLFKREVGMYSVSAYFVARFLNEIPRCIIWPIPFVAITASTVELPNHSLTVLELYIALIISGFASTAYGLGMGALFISSGMMADVMPCADLPLFLMSGAFLRISSLPFWLYPVKFISHFYYAMDAISNIYWRQIGDIECPTNTTTVCVKDGAAVLLENGYSDNFVLEDTVGLLFVATLWSVVGYWGLKREEKKGYAY